MESEEIGADVDQPWRDPQTVLRPSRLHPDPTDTPVVDLHVDREAPGADSTHKLDLHDDLGQIPVGGEDHQPADRFPDRVGRWGTPIAILPLPAVFEMTESDPFGHRDQVGSHVESLVGSEIDELQLGFCDGGLWRRTASRELQHQHCTLQCGCQKRGSSHEQ